MLKSICFSLNGLVVLFKFVTLIYSSDEIIKQIKYKWHVKDLHNQGHLEIRQIASKHTRYALGHFPHNDCKKQKQKALESRLPKSLFLNSYWLTSYILF